MHNAEDLSQLPLDTISHHGECAGAGIGLRIPHIHHVLKHKPNIPWFEVHPCNFLRGGLNRELLYRVAESYPLSFHGVNLNLGGIEAINRDYLSRLNALIKDLKPSLISDHACFTQLGSQHFHDLLPIPYTAEAVDHFANRINQIQDLFQQPILIENVSRYTEYEESSMSEADFLTQLCQRTGCRLLLDLNNAYVNQLNLGISVDAFLQAIPSSYVQEIHLAGHSKQDGYVVDTHDSKVSAAVWSIYSKSANNYPSVPCLIEWDSKLPAFNTLEEERLTAETIFKESQLKATNSK